MNKSRQQTIHLRLPSQAFRRSKKAMVDEQRKKEKGKKGKVVI